VRFDQSPRLIRLGVDQRYWSVADLPQQMDGFVAVEAGDVEQDQRSIRLFRSWGGHVDERAVGAVVEVLAQCAVEKSAGGKQHYARLGGLESRHSVIVHSHVLC
jgi:hypothetical protein